MVHLQGHTQEEWKDVKAAAAALGPAGAELEELLGRTASCLVMDYIPGTTLFQARQPFETAKLHETATDLGR